MWAKLIAFTIAVFGSMFLNAQPALAWSEEGHRTVCELAYRELTTNSRSVLLDLFQSNQGGIHLPAKSGKGGSTAARWYTAFNKGCLEQDTRPRAHSSQHFINVARKTPSITADLCPAMSGKPDIDTDCIFNGIEAARRTLKDPSRSRADRVDALMALGHWIGDLHQPLHVSFDDDAGGNDISVRMAAPCGSSTSRPDKLHAVWDDCLVEAGIFEKARADLTARHRSTVAPGLPYAAATLLDHRTTLSEKQAWIASQPWQWAQESYLYTIEGDVSYCTLKAGKCWYSATVEELPKNKTEKAPLIRTQLIGATYVKNYAPVAEERIRKAGIRLGHLINQSLDPTYAGPTASGS